MWLKQMKKVKMWRWTLKHDLVREFFLRASAVTEAKLGHPAVPPCCGRQTISDKGSIDMRIKPQML